MSFGDDTLDPSNKRPEATHFTVHEGGHWHEWIAEDAPRVGRVHCVKFKDGWVWDSYCGWRPPS